MHESPSGKVYIGQTCADPKRRWNNGYGYRSNRYFWSAIQKYGWKSFQHTILASGLDQENANFLEKRFIQIFCSDDRRYGYNIQLGGRSSGGMSPEAKEHMIAVKSGDNAPNARKVVAFSTEGKRIAEFTCISYAASTYGIKRSTLLTHLSKHSGTCNGMIFRYYDDVAECEQLPPDEVYKPHEQRSLRGKGKRVNVYDLSGRFVRSFGSISEAANYLCVCNATVCEVLHRGSGTVAKHIVRYGNVDDCCEDIVIEKPVVVNAQCSKRKPICQYTLGGEFIHAYESISSASVETGITIYAISSCLRTRNHHSGGFQWRYDSGDHSNIPPAKSKTDVRKENRSYPYKPIWKLDPITHERIERFESLRSAARAVNVDKANIQAVIKGRKKTCRGYCWEYDV